VKHRLFENVGQKNKCFDLDSCETNKVLKKTEQIPLALSLCISCWLNSNTIKHTHDQYHRVLTEVRSRLCLHWSI